MSDVYEKFDKQIYLRPELREFLKLPIDEINRRIEDQQPVVDEQYFNKELKRSWYFESRVYVTKLLDELLRVICYSAINNPDNLKEIFKDTEHIKFDENQEPTFIFSNLLRLSFIVMLTCSHIDNPKVRNFIIEYLEMAYQYHSDESMKTKIQVVQEPREIYHIPHTLEKTIIDTLLINLYPIIDLTGGKEEAYKRIRQEIERMKNQSQEPTKQ